MLTPRSIQAYKNFSGQASLTLRRPVTKTASPFRRAVPIRRRVRSSGDADADRQPATAAQEDSFSPAADGGRGIIVAFPSCAVPRSSAGRRPRLARRLYFDDGDNEGTSPSHPSGSRESGDGPSGCAESHWQWRWQR